MALVVGMTAGWAAVHRRHTPDARAGLTWPAACGGSGAADVKNLLGRSSGVTVVMTTSSTNNPYLSWSVCNANSPHGNVRLRAGRVLDHETISQYLARNGSPNPSQHATVTGPTTGARALAAGDAGRSWPDYAIVHITCHPSGAPTFAWGVTVDTTGTAAGTDAAHRHLLDDLASRYADYLEHRTDCTTGA